MAAFIISFPIALKIWKRVGDIEVVFDEMKVVCQECPY